MSHGFGFLTGDEIPSTLSDEREHERSDSVHAGNYFAVGASVRGKLHERSGDNRDDAFMIHFDGTWLVTAVSDGAGSRPKSGHGASYSVNTLCHKLLEATQARTKTNLGEPVGLEGLVRQAFRDTRTGLEQFASENAVPLEDLHCTLLGLILNVETGEIGVGQVGDGLILGLDINKEASPVVEPPDTGQPGTSYFLTQANWEEYLCTKPSIIDEKLACLSTFYLMTDGVADDCQYGPPADILARWANDIDREIRSIPSLEEAATKLKSYLRTYQAKGSFDDRTLVVICKNNTGK